jgi:ABC-type anion transport system duplicated permease subunit
MRLFSANRVRYVAALGIVSGIVSGIVIFCRLVAKWLIGKVAQVLGSIPITAPFPTGPLNAVAYSCALIRA